MIFQCTIIVELIPTDKPKGVTIATNATRNTVRQGQNVALTCDVSEAKPAVSEYRFYLNGSILTPVTNVNKFIIQDVKRSRHFGKYKVVAHNDAGDGQSDQVVLNITGKSLLRDSQTY